MRDAVKAQWVEHINEQWSRDLALEHNEEQLKKLDELARDDDLARGGNGVGIQYCKKNPVASLKEDLVKVFLSKVETKEDENRKAWADIRNFISKWIIYKYPT